MVLLMGNTGAGKSYFANRLKENATLESNGLESCTQECQLVQTKVGRTNVTVVDCPGFNDTHKSDTEVLKTIAKILSSQYIVRENVQLRGIIYFWDITRGRMEGSDVKALEIFSKLVGEKAFPHVVFVTTMWGRLTDRDKELAFQREKQLRDDFWGDMLARGSHATRFDGNKASAEGLLAQIIMKKNISLRIQHELVEKDMTLESTAAGACLVPVVKENISKFKNVRS
jgi:GTP-binding protein EngB required for normal cell division